MTKSVEQKKQLAELHRQIWDVACGFWGKMEADDYKDYVLGLLFYRFLSEKVEDFAAKLLVDDLRSEDVEGTDMKAGQPISYAEAWADEQKMEDVRDEILAALGFVIEPHYLFSHMVWMIQVGKNDDEFDISHFREAITSLGSYAKETKANEVFDGIFDVMDLDSSKLGRTTAQRTKMMATALSSINKIGFRHEDLQIDLMGDAYEYLIGQFASGAGKKSGSYYTPSQAGVLLARLATVGKTRVENAYDGCGGSGSLLLHVGEQVDVQHYYYQELTTNTYNLARMNMLLHEVPYDSIHMANDDTLENPSFMDKKMDVIVANPPYSLKWGAESTHLLEDRFSEFGVLPPKGYADYAFLMTMLHTLKEDGTMSILLPHGPLFRGGKEADIRKKLIEGNYVDAVIGLPDNAFYGTSIPTAIFVLKKNRQYDDILFIDASKDFIKEGNKNYIHDASIDKILDVYNSRRKEERYSYLATKEEVKSNSYNLNIPRYVDTSIEETIIDLKITQEKYALLQVKGSDLDRQIAIMASVLFMKNVEGGK